MLCPAPNQIDPEELGAVTQKYFTQKSIKAVPYVVGFFLRLNKIFPERGFLNFFHDSDHELLPDSLLKRPAVLAFLPDLLCRWPFISADFMKC